MEQETLVLAEFGSIGAEGNRDTNFSMVIFFYRKYVTPRLDDVEIQIPKHINARHLIYAW